MYTVTTRSRISRIFYVLSAPSIAVFMFVCGLIELLCGLALVHIYNHPMDGVFSILALSAAALFFTITWSTS